MVIVRQLLLGTLTVGIIMGTATQARAQGFISPMLGFNFGGVSGCPQLNSCKDKQRNLSVAAGKFGTIFGAEMEIAYSPALAPGQPTMAHARLSLSSGSGPTFTSKPAVP